MAKMKLRSILLALIVLATLTCSRAESTTEVDPIDVALGAAMEKDPSTAGMVEALAKAGDAWDARMNAVYGTLKKKMEPEEWTALVAAQKAWIAFRDAQVKSFDATFALMEGTMYVPMYGDLEMQLTKERAQFLANYLEIIENR